jgi:hypothetical protein
MNRVNFFLLLLAGLLVQTHTLMAGEQDFSGLWDSDVGPLQLEQSGSKVIAIQKDSDIAALLGRNMFEAEASGNLLKGRIATILPGIKKELCGKNWARWVDLELTLSQDGNRLEGKWLRYTQITTEAGCPINGTQWKPWLLTRNLISPQQAPDMAISKINNSTIISTISMIGFSVVFFFIRNSYVSFLVGSLKRSPNNAGLAGWWLFSGLMFCTLIGCIAIVNGSYLTLSMVVGLTMLSLWCLIMCFVSSLKK